MSHWHADTLVRRWLQGQVVWMFQILMKLIGLGGTVTRLATAPTLEEQQQVRACILW